MYLFFLPQFFNALIICYCIWFMATHLFFSYILLISRHHFHNIRPWGVTYFFQEKSFEEFFHLSFPCFLFAFILGIPFTVFLSLFTHFEDFMPSSLFYSLVQKAASFSNLVRLKMTKDMMTTAQILSPELHCFNLNKCFAGVLS